MVSTFYADFIILPDLHNTLYYYDFSTISTRQREAVNMEVMLQTLNINMHSTILYTICLICFSTEYAGLSQRSDTY